MNHGGGLVAFVAAHYDLSESLRTAPISGMATWIINFVASYLKIDFQQTLKPLLDGIASNAGDLVANIEEDIVSASLSKYLGVLLLGLEGEAEEPEAAATLMGDVVDAFVAMLDDIAGNLDLDFIDVIGGFVDTLASLRCHGAHAGHDHAATGGTNCPRGTGCSERQCGWRRHDACNHSAAECHWALSRS